MVISFAFLREGSSDDALISHLRSLVIEFGGEEVIGSSRNYHGTTKDKMEQLLLEPSPVDFVVVHRDSDSRSHERAYEEIVSAAAETQLRDRVVPIVPVQELEAWLLVDEVSIRAVVGKPRGSAPLEIPQLSRIEQQASPKEILQRACLNASEAHGARRKKIARDFGYHRASLIERLDRSGPVKELPSWKRFISDLQSVVARLRSAEGDSSDA